MANGSNHLWVWGLGALIVVGGVVLGITKSDAPSNIQSSKFEDKSDADKINGANADSALPSIVAKSAPVVTGFRGDLANGGSKENDGTVIPFVIGEYLTLDADATNATEYRWTVNGILIKDKDLEWSTRKEREYEISAASDLRFTVQVRGADKNLPSLPKEVIIKPVPLYIKSFDALLTEEPDRSLTGEDYSVEVDMQDPVGADPDFYRFRYLVNDVPVKHPDDGLEWTTERDFTYTFPAPGRYSFKVEARRSTEKEPEDSKVLAETIVAADAVALSFDTTPEKYAPVGTTVDMNMFPISIFGKSECRFGVKKIVEADFKWLEDETGTIWGESERSWLPNEPGNYLVRAEVREAGKEQADDFREVFYTVTEGDF